MIINSSKHLVAYLIPELEFISLIKVLDIHEIHAHQLEKIISNVGKTFQAKIIRRFVQIQYIHLCAKIVMNTKHLIMFLALLLVSPSSSLYRPI